MSAEPQPKAEVLDVQAFERNCTRFLRFKNLEHNAKNKADALKAKIMTEVERFGLVPEQAPKSRRLESSRFVVTRTVGTSTEIDDSKATELELVLANARKSKFFPLLFERRVEYVQTKDAHKVIEQERWPKRHAERIKTLYALCFKSKQRTPSLDVETREAYDAAKAKAVAKAAKKGGR